MVAGQSLYSEKMRSDLKGYWTVFFSKISQEELLAIIHHSFMVEFQNGCGTVFVFRKNEILHQA